MKEIIQKRFEKSKESFIKRGIDIYNNFTFLVLTRFTNDILKEIDEQELKPFNPCECGFVLNDNGYFVNDSKKITNEVRHLEVNNYSIYCYEFVYGQYNFPEMEDILHIPNINIPNHDFGVQLLRNLGVIK